MVNPKKFLKIFHVKFVIVEGGATCYCDLDHKDVDIDRDTCQCKRKSANLLLDVFSKK